ncbi:helix-turn-helix transcriptional regulator [Planctomicrobium sp. SH527]|uniref:helix-turn-helix domain-containing protein n=1 Tax=Planctomicrobium sp. SH527 TaxID=3448123 RepID=UPI003F5C8377
MSRASNQKRVSQRITDSEWDSFSIEEVRSDQKFYEPVRSNHFCIWNLNSGAGTAFIDAAQFPFVANQLLFVVPYQYVRFALEGPFQAQVLRFHANFLCVETFHKETGCSGPLFNDPYGRPVVQLDEVSLPIATSLFTELISEQKAQLLGVQEAQLAYTRLLMIHAARWKGGNAVEGGENSFRHPVIESLKVLIEQNYCSLHAPADYAALLHMTPQSLGRCVREQLGKTLSDLIQQRVLTHAKWELLHTLRTVKEIAAEVGYQDELYFSRVFKKGTGVSPKYFREHETRIRGGSNLSMNMP